MPSPGSAKHLADLELLQVVTSVARHTLPVKLEGSKKVPLQEHALVWRPLLCAPWGWVESP